MCVISYKRQWPDVGKVLKMGHRVPNNSFAEVPVVYEIM